MNRSKWKGPYVNMELFNNFKNKNIKITSRNSTILPQFVGLNVQIYNGKSFNLINIKENMVGYKFGEFSSTRQPFKYKKK